MEKRIEKKESNLQDEWRKMISECQSSGLGVKEYCKSKGITPNTYYYYMKKTRKREETVPQLLPVVFAKPEEKPSILNISYHGATIQITINDETSLCAVLTALKKV